MFRKIKQGYKLGRDLSELLKHVESDLNPLIYPNDHVGKKYDEIHKSVSHGGLFSEIGFRFYFLINSLDEYQSKAEERIIYLELRKNNIIKDNSIKTMEDIIQKSI